MLTATGWLRWTQLLALAICIGFGLAFVIANVRSWELEDSEAYWQAALRLRDSQPLYVPVHPGADEMIAYRYSPWFAWLWVPLTLLPKGAVQVGWSLVLLVSAGAALLPLVRLRTVSAICLVALLGGLLVRTASTGNVHALLMAALVYGAPRRSGPIWIGIAASLKFAPIAYVLLYLGRGEWRRATVAVLVGAVLLAPALLYDLGRYPADPGESLSLLSMAGPVPWAALAVVCVSVAVGLARGRHAWAAASVAVLAVIPRLQLYDLTYLLVGLGGRTRSSSSRPATRRRGMSQESRRGSPSPPPPGSADARAAGGDDRAIQAVRGRT
jgi:hypothetical protein